MLKSQSTKMYCIYQNLDNIYWNLSSQILQFMPKII